MIKSNLVARHDVNSLAIVFIRAIGRQLDGSFRSPSLCKRIVLEVFQELGTSCNSLHLLNKVESIKQLGSNFSQCLYLILSGPGLVLF